MFDDIQKNHLLRFFVPVGLAIIAIYLLFININQYNNKKLHKINDRYEGCLSCHLPMIGFSQSHNPEDLGCSSCHLGDPFTLIKEDAHTGLILIPGNIENANLTCGQSKCHPVLSSYIQNALMTTGRGMVAVNHFVFGESESPDGSGNLANLEDSPADKHLRNLCASCHLAQTKKIPEPNTQLSRGGGCLACHLKYTKSAETDLDKYKNENEFPINHPSLTINISNDQCFGCHSRSGRISTNYEGWHETLLDSIPEVHNSSYRMLDDGRIFIKQQADIHFEKGMDCIDCHTWRELMGNGNSYNHKEEQIEIQCEDCHTNILITNKHVEKDNDIDEKLLRLRGWDSGKQNFLLTKKTQKPLLNTQIVENKTQLKSKNRDKIHSLKPPLPICKLNIIGHNRLTCKSCHSAWASHCLGCHTRYMSNETVYDHIKNEFSVGGWIEFSSDFIIDEPTLGIRIENEHEIVDTFIPGMILTIKDYKSKEKFRRLYAPTAPHTTSAKSRSCKSCHNNPLAIGFGRGEMKFEKIENNYGTWVFLPKYEINPIDNLPEDAWTGFLESRSGMISTRIGARPFNVEEQKTILKVGTCLICHEDNSENQKKIYSNFDSAVNNLSEKCMIMKE